MLLRFLGLEDALETRVDALPLDGRVVDFLDDVVEGFEAVLRPGPVEPEVVDGDEDQALNEHHVSEIFHVETDVMLDAGRVDPEVLGWDRVVLEGEEFSWRTVNTFFDQFLHLHVFPST